MHIFVGRYNLTTLSRSDAEKLPGNGRLVSRAVVPPLCLDKDYGYPQVSEEVYVNGFAGVYPLEKITLCKFYT